MNDVASTLFNRLPVVRYVATYVNGKLELRQRAGLQNASESESDKYEELIVNPTLLKLVTQRGDIDCGGVQYVVVRYGSFFEFVQTVPGGHISVGIEPHADLQGTIAAIRSVLAE